MLKIRIHTVCSPKRCSRLVVSCWSKKKGLVKKPKKANVQPEETKSQETKETNEAPPPPRILDTGPRSLKSQLRIVKKAQAERNPPPTKVTYRRPKESKPLATVGAEAVRPKRILKPEPKRTRPKTAQEIETEIAEQQARERRLKIASLYRRKVFNGTPAALLIDGYNVMLQWLEEPGQRRLKRTSGDSFDCVREAFLRDISAYCAKELRVMVAFDAMGNLSAPTITRELFGGIEIIFVGTSEADAFIVTEANSLRKLGTPYVLVASNDNDVSEACWSNEIFPMSSVQLLHEIKKGKQDYRRQQAQLAFKANGRDLGSKMMAASPNLYLELERMRRGC